MCKLTFSLIIVMDFIPKRACSEMLSVPMLIFSYLYTRYICIPYLNYSCFFIGRLYIYYRYRMGNKPSQISTFETKLNRMLVKQGLFFNCRRTQVIVVPINQFYASVYQSICIVDSVRLLLPPVSFSTLPRLVSVGLCPYPYPFRKRGCKVYQGSLTDDS